MNDERMERDLKELLFEKCADARDRWLDQKRLLPGQEVTEIVKWQRLVALFELIEDADLVDDYGMWLRDNGRYIGD